MNIVESQMKIFLSYAANPNTCTMHLINDGVTVNEDTATVEFAGSGPTTSFQCRLDGQAFSPCELELDVMVQFVHPMPY